MSVMEILQIIAEIILAFFAFWKLYELFFPKKPKYTMKDRIIDHWTENYLLTRFFAEFTYKVMKNNKDYENAPPEVYKWLEQNFKDWADKQNH